MDGEADDLAVVGLDESRVAIACQGGGFRVASASVYSLAEAHQLAPSAGIVSETVRDLLHAAMFAAQQNHSDPVHPRKFTLTRYLLSLVSNYYTTEATPRCFAKAAERFSQVSDHRKSKLAQRKSVEEAGHHRLALSDLDALGYHGEELVSMYYPERASKLVTYLEEITRNPHPVQCFGYAYTLERLAMFVTSETVQRVQRHLPSNANATKCLRTHSSIGSDPAHVEHALHEVAMFESEHIQSVVVAAYRTMDIVTRVYVDDEWSDEDIQKALRITRKIR